MKKEEPEFYDDIHQYLNTKSMGNPIKLSYNDDLISYISAYLDYDKDTCKNIIQAFFEEIRIALLNGEDVLLQGLGNICIKKTKFKNKYRVTFLASKSLKKYL